MAIKPILFNTDMVRAILDGRKTCTRRLVNPQPDAKHTYLLGIVTNSTEKKDIGRFGFGIDEYGGSIQYAKAPYQLGDIMYVREPWHKYNKRVGEGEGCHLAELYGYKASIENSEDANEPWRPSIHMPKEAARIWLRVTDVRVERLQEMTGQDVLKEGLNSHVHPQASYFDCNQREMFENLWNSIMKKLDLNQYHWDANPWVWVIEFERCENPDDVQTSYNFAKELFESDMRDFTKEEATTYKASLKKIYTVENEIKQK